MAKMKAEELRGKSIDQLAKLETEKREQLFKLRFQIATGQSENPGRIRVARRELARVKTVMLELHKREAASAAASVSTGEANG